MHKNESFKRNVIYFLMIVAAVVVCYSNTLHGDFHFDDDLTITENQKIKDIKNIIHMNWIHSFLQGGRPITELTFALNYALGGIHVVGYHVVNLLIHLFVVFWVYLFTRKTLKLDGHEKSAVLALIITGIFGLHPVQSESVTYISQRSEALASLFCLMSLFFFIKARERGFNRKGALLYIAGLTVFVIGIGAKEIVITLPALYMLYDFYFLDKKPLLKRLAVPAPFIIFALIYIGMRFLDLKDNTAAGFNVAGVTAQEYLMTQFRVIVTYLRLIVFPVHQNLDYDVPIHRNFFEPETFLSFFFLISICAIAVVWRRRFKVASFGVLWFFIVISPTSSFIPVIDVIFEHRIYLALWGIVTAVVLVLYEAYVRLLSGRSFFARNPGIAGKFASASVLAVMIIFGAALYERNKVWQTKLSLWTDVASKSPNKPRAHNNLGNCYFIQNDFSAAIPHYKRAITLDPTWYESYYNLAVSLENIGRKADAVYYYLIFAREAPDAYNPLKREIFNKYRIAR
jgi:hypothetical protein